MGLRRNETASKLTNQRTFEADADTSIGLLQWKRLSAGGRRGVSRADFFRLFAYVHHYDTRHNVLLYRKLSP